MFRMTCRDRIWNRKNRNQKAHACQSESGGYQNICDALAKHLSNQKIVENCKDPKTLIKHLADGDSTLLKLATSEALAWFNYARRFIK